MTDVDTPSVRDGERTLSASFGTGGADPYARALSAQMGQLTLKRVDSSPAAAFDVSDWLRPATDADLTSLDGSAGPLLDVGCGPGRMVRAATDRGLSALGVDVSREAITHTRLSGSKALERSVFDRMPLEGQWRTILLMDGNVGIGGDPTALLTRCRELLAPTGTVVVELDGDALLDDTAHYTVVDRDGFESAPFPWARIGRVGLERAAAASDLNVIGEWTVADRHFVRLTPVA